jgi:hypothetical protein
MHYVIKKDVRVYFYYDIKILYGINIIEENELIEEDFFSLGDCTLMNLIISGSNKCFVRLFD